MHSVEQALQIVLSAARPLEVQRCMLSRVAGLVLAEEVVSDIDMPPFDKSLVDGYAVVAASMHEGRGELSIVGEIVAGSSVWPVERRIGAGQAVSIMTGGPIPPGCDAVVMVERTRPLADGRVAITDTRLRIGQHIMRRGTELTAGQAVLRVGSVLRPAEIGVLAAVGRPTVPVYPRVRVAISSTGSELVEVDTTPGSGQIRNSNGPMLTALVADLGATPEYLGIARDTAFDLERHIRDGLKADILVLSGGVSAGMLDLVPAVLRRLGARELFHKVNMKPGKPVWFGVAPDEPGRAQAPCLIFGLPGNPGSVMACFELFVAPAIRRMMGFSRPGPTIVSAVLADDRTNKSDRPTYWPAWLEQSDDGRVVRLVGWKGSPDLRATTEANCFAIFPAGDRQFRRGERIEVLAYSIE